MQKIIKIALGGVILFGFLVPATWARPLPFGLLSWPEQPQKSTVANPLQSYDLNAQLIAAKKKNKVKHNYQTYLSITASGNQNNSDGTVTDTSGTGSVTSYYRKLAVSKLLVSNPFAFSVLEKPSEDLGLGEEVWADPGVFADSDECLMSDGNLWFMYGQSDPSYYDYGNGDYRYFGYNGGTEEKVRNHPAYKVYNFSVTGAENNADVVAPLYGGSDQNYYYRKLSIPNLKADNLMDYQIFMKSTSQIGGQETWIPVEYFYFVTDGAIYVAYGYKSGGGSFQADHTGDYRVFVYSNGKSKKKKLTKQYVKEYTFNVPTGGSNADKTVGSGSVKDYFKELVIPGLKTTDYPNIKALYQSKFNAGIGQVTWCPAVFLVADGQLLAWYGENDNSTYSDFASGNYQVFLYK